MPRHENEFTLMTVVVRVYAPTSWSDEQGAEALTGMSEGKRVWDFAATDLPRVITEELEGFQREVTMPEGMRFEVTS